MDTLFVALIVLVAASWAARRLWRTYRAHRGLGRGAAGAAAGPGCDCASAGSCAAASQCHVAGDAPAEASAGEDADRPGVS